MRAPRPRRLADVFDWIHERAGVVPTVPTRTMAEFVLAIGSGAILERLADPAALGEGLIEMAVGAFGLGPSAGGARSDETSEGTAVSTRTKRTPFDDMRRWLQDEMRRRMPDHTRRLSLPPGDICLRQRNALRALLAHAIANRPFHAARLGGLDARSSWTTSARCR